MKLSKSYYCMDFYAAMVFVVGVVFVIGTQTAYGMYIVQKYIDPSANKISFTSMGLFGALFVVMSVLCAFVNWFTSDNRTKYIETIKLPATSLKHKAYANANIVTFDDGTEEYVWKLDAWQNRSYRKKLANTDVVVFKKFYNKNKKRVGARLCL